MTYIENITNILNSSSNYIFRYWITNILINDPVFQIFIFLAIIFITSKTIRALMHLNS